MAPQPDDLPDSNSSQSSALQADGEKRNPQDPSLDLIRRPTVNRKLLRAGIVVFASVVFVGIILGMQPNKPKAAQAKAKGPQSYAAETPGNLDITPDDYTGLRPEQPVQNAALRPYSAGNAQPGVGSNQSTAPQYGTYTQSSPSPEQRAQYPVQQPNALPVAQGTLGATGPGQVQQPASQSIFTPNFSGTQPLDEETKRRLAALTSGFFFQLSSQTSQQASSSQRQAAAPQPDPLTQDQTNAIASAYDSAYNKQNMQKEKQAFLDNQRGDYTAYLDNHALSPIDAAHLLQAATIVPITMVTAINSDLPPREIIAQVTENVFDSLTGQNILIPRGSKLVGTYDSNVSFGQDRVIVAWQRLIRTDGVSISLRGMEGADMQGKAGLHDQVDYHLANILAVVGASTAFNVATNAAISAMSTNKFLSSLSQAMTAQGSNSSNVTSAANAAAIAYATKIIDQAPTIVIREGTAAYCLIDKDMILPAFVDRDGGYFPTH